MLYVLPPPRAPDPPSPWESILCTSSTSNNGSVTERTPWELKQMKPPLAKLFNNKNRSKHNDTSKTVPNEKDDTRANKSLAECYFAGRGTAMLVSSGPERPRQRRRPSAPGPDIQQHLHSMFHLLRPEETLKMAVKLESVHPLRTRYLVVVSRGVERAEESCLLGIDCNERTTIGLVLRVLADTTITLDGDGGFSVSVCRRHHIFKPVSVQAMWSALQTLHKISSKAREQNYFEGGPTHEWVSYYDQRIESDQSCLNEWHAMDSLESRRPPSPNSIRTKPTERDEAEMIIRTTLKEIMMSVDLDEVTSKCIRNRLEEDLNMNLGEYKSFIDQEMLTILGQMDSPTEIFQHVYLGSEWNASNFEELQKNGIGHILNVTREIDNFFPGMFDYLNIRVYDDEKTDLLKYWDNTFKYITKAKNQGSKVLVHCKMGVSRSASVVIAYAMKAYNWDFEKALKHVKEKRSCIKPNTSFIAQLETYQGILDAMKNKEKLQRSKSETNLKSQENKTEKKTEVNNISLKSSRRESKMTLSGRTLKQIGARPKSWSPDNRSSTNLFGNTQIPAFLSLENLSQIKNQQKIINHIENARNILIPFNNGQSYSVSPNQIVHIPGNCTKHDFYEKTKANEKKGMVLNLTNQFESDPKKNTSPNEEVQLSNYEDLKISTAQINLTETWDPGEKTKQLSNENIVWTSSAILKQQGTVKKNDFIDTKKSELDCKIDLNDKKNILEDNINTNTNKKTNLEPNFKKTFSENFNLKKTEVSNQNDNKKIITSETISTKKTDIDPTNIKKEPDNTKKDSDPTIAKIIVRKEGDPFSNRVDKVFDREERRHKCQTTDLDERKCPSRQSSWSSYDSAVVLGYQGESRDAPSRHSSWGSGDTRTLPSRNSSWGSYDMRKNHIGQTITEKEDKSDTLSASSCGMFTYDKNDIPSWYPGTVKRTKQKLENNSEITKRLCSTPKNLDHPINMISPSIEMLPDLSSNCRNTIIHYQSSPALCSKKSSENISKISDKIDISSSRLNETSRLSVSAPGSSNLSVINTDFVPFNEHKNRLLTKKISDNIKDSVDSNSLQGLVKNRKKEFEAKNGTEERDKNVPLSPKVTENEDISVKELVGKYEIAKADDLETSPILRQKQFNNKNNRYSCIEVLSKDKETYNSIIPPHFSDSDNKPKSLETRPKSAFISSNVSLNSNGPINSNGPLNSLLNPNGPLNPLLNTNGPLNPFLNTNGPLNPNVPLNPPLNPTFVSTKAPITSFVKSSVVKAAVKKQMRNRDFSSFNVKTRNHPTHNTM